MTPLVWSEKYSVQVESIDKQHRRLMDLINELARSHEQGKSADTLDGVFEELGEYIKTHFFLEEQLMRQYKYPEFERHRAEHEVFRQKIKTLRMRLIEKSNNDFVAANVLEYLRNWLSGHILGTDKQYGPFLKEQGVK